MSAFIVSDKHISAMIFNAVTGNRISYYWNGKRHQMNCKSQEIGQKLVDENYRSVNSRYGENGQPHEFVMQHLERRYSPIEIIKACHCYNYQACETQDYFETEAHAIVKAIEASAVRDIAGYEQAAWEIH
jgi:hypothetical protein